jgi:hypothetical protein
MLPLLILCSGCVSLENSQRLMSHPDFDKVVAASAEWTTDALKTINRLEAMVEGE